MGGGKSTPRQKMIEMMYLVLTALLALNISRQIINAFITINTKLENSCFVIDKATEDIFHTFDQKRAFLIATKSPTKTLDYWYAKATKLDTKTDQLIHFLMAEANQMIVETEGLEKGKDWIAVKDENGYYKKLKPLLAITAPDNYETPTRLFVGDNPMHPNKRGLALVDSLNYYRNTISELMGTYKVGDKQYTFKAPETIEGLEEALKTANPDDTAEIARFYRSMTIPKMIKVKSHGDIHEYPWPAAMFNNTPIVAAVAMFNSKKLDILNSKNHAMSYLLSKVNTPKFSFNKIEPLAFARTGYINQGDSLELKVMIAAYDSTDVPKIRFGVNDSTSENWKEVTGAIKLSGATPGDYVVNGVIGVEVKGQTEWKDWEFRYTVGAPTGTVSLPMMNVLYRGYNNIVVGAASGFPSYSLSSGGNVSLSKQGDHYIAKPGRARKATINIAGVAQDGTSTSLGSFEFRVRNLPKASIKLGRINSGDAVSSSAVRASRRLFAGYPPSIPLKAEFRVIKWNLAITGYPREVSGTGATLNTAALRALANAESGATVTITGTYTGPGGSQRQVCSFKIK